MALGKPWYAYDLDGTLAEYHGWVSIDHIGKPVERLITEVKVQLALGHDVRIFTARVWPLGIDREATGLTPNEYIARRLQAQLALEVIQKWSAEQFDSIVLPVTCIKDYGMISLADDRLKQVIPNTGIYVDDLLNEANFKAIELEKQVSNLIAELHYFRKEG